MLPSSGLACYSVLKMEALRSSETVVGSNQTARRYNPEDVVHFLPARKPVKHSARVLLAPLSLFLLLPQTPKRDG